MRAFVIARNCRVGKSYCVSRTHLRYGPLSRPQHGHLGMEATSALIKRARMVAIEFGMWRSGRKGGSTGSITAG